MEMTGEQLIRATQADTWAALNDPAILKECVPGCESIELTGGNEYAVLMTARVGPVSAKFSLIDEYDSTPAAGTDSNSLYLAFGLSVGW